jgi:hypothetical protein
MIPLRSTPVRECRTRGVERISAESFALAFGRHSREESFSKESFGKKAASGFYLLSPN